MTLWMAVSPDRLELPIAVEDTAIKLASTLDTTVANIRSKKCRKQNGENCGYKIITVKCE